METMNVTQLKENSSNPRLITPEGLDKLVNSLIAFPKMLQMRPIVINDRDEILGGNMRAKALTKIVLMDRADLEKRIAREVEKGLVEPEAAERLTQWWKEWQKAPQVPVISGNDMTDQEQRQFIIKDNVQAGYWDFEKLDGWDKSMLQEMGLEQWDDSDEVDLMSHFTEQGGGLTKNDSHEDKLQTFSATFLLPKSARDAYYDYLEKNGKELLANFVIDFICQDVEAR